MEIRQQLLDDIDTQLGQQQWRSKESYQKRLKQIAFDFKNATALTEEWHSREIGYQSLLRTYQNTISFWKELATRPELRESTTEMLETVRAKYLDVRSTRNRTILEILSEPN